MSPDSPASTPLATNAPAEIRAKLALALDLDDLVEALRLARMLRPWFGVAKVGLELYCAAGPDAVSSLADAGFDVFVDLKLLDIPTTVQHASRVLGSLGARYLTLHARGDSPMLRAGVEGFLDGAEAAGLPDPIPLAVTVLTSDDTAPPHVVPHRIALAVEAGCGGIVCAAADVRDAKELAPRLVTVVPGIRPPGSDAHDQARAATPRQAIDAGADVLVIGRAVTQAPDPAAAAAAVVDQLL
jgi:orotidine-5'-phosphate decarboxylase